MSSARGVFSLILAAFACALLLMLGTAAAATASTIEGEVSAEEGGAPLEKVLVCAYLLSSELEEICDATDAAGKYAIEDLEAGSYKVEFWPRFGRLPYFTEYWNDRETFSTADKIVLDESETADELDAELEASAMIEGTVTAEVGGAPLQEIEVCAYGEEFGSCAWTDAQGEYAITGLSSDVYKLEFFDWEGVYMPQYYDHRNRWQEAEELPVEVGETVAGIDAEMRVGGQIRGTVTAAASSAPVPGIWVCAVDSASTSLVGCGDTNFSGQYTIPALATDAYRVVFSIDLAEWFGEGSEPDGYDTQFYNAQTSLAAANPVAVVAPGSTPGIDARLRKTGEATVPPPPPPANPAVKKKKTCKRGFKKKKVKGKVRCVKVHKGKKGKRGKGSKPRFRVLLRS